jgi:CelD/BcsL family acetyltransferase involved in cellulose biosynthesis
MHSRLPLEVTVHRGDPADLNDVWMTLADPLHPGAAFRSAAWLAPWWKSHSHGHAAHILIARRGTRPVALLPLYREGRRYRLMGDGVVGSDYLGVIAHRENLDEASRILAFHLATLDADEVELDGLDADDPFINALGAAFGPRVAVEPRYLCPRIELRQSFSSYLHALPDGIGEQWHRRKKWLEKRAGYRLDVLRSPAEVAAGMESLLALHRRRWEIEGGSDGITPAVEEFHRDAARRLAALGWAVLFLLHAEGAPRAALYGFRHGDRFAFYQSGHEPEWRPRSVGTVLLGHTIRWAADQGCSEYDFLRGDEPYKLKWANGARRTVRVRVVGAGLGPWLRDWSRRSLGDLRNHVKRALPAETLEWLRRARRSWR